MPSRPIRSLLFSTTLAILPPLVATTLVDDNFSRPGDWRLITPGPALSYGLDGATLTLPNDDTRTNYTLAYVGGGLRPNTPNASSSFEWSTNKGPVTYAFTVAAAPSTGTAPYKLGYEIILALALNQRTPVEDAHAKPADLLLFRIVDAGPRSDLQGRSFIPAQVFIKTGKPGVPIVYHNKKDELARLTNHDDPGVTTLVGTWSFTINGDQIHITNPRGTRSALGTLPPAWTGSDLHSATLHLVVGRNTLPGGESLRFTHFSVLAGDR